MLVLMENNHPITPLNGGDNHPPFPVCWSHKLVERKGVKMMYTHGSINLVVNEQNRRIREAQMIAQAYNQAKQNPMNLFGRLRSLLFGRDRKQDTPIQSELELDTKPC
jgi:hypothetical protein